MKKAVPNLKKVSRRSQLALWEREFDNFLRPLRRNEKNYRNHVILIPQNSVELICNEGTLPLDILNDLPPTRDEEYISDPESADEENDDVDVQI